VFDVGTERRPFDLVKGVTGLSSVGRTLELSPAKATLGDLVLRGEVHMGFSERIDTTLELNLTVGFSADSALK